MNGENLITVEEAERRAVKHRFELVPFDKIRIPVTGGGRHSLAWPLPFTSAPPHTQCVAN